MTHKTNDVNAVLVMFLPDGKVLTVERPSIYLEQDGRVTVFLSVDDDVRQYLLDYEEKMTYPSGFVILRNNSIKHFVAEVFSQKSILAAPNNFRLTLKKGNFELTV